MISRRVYNAKDPKQRKETMRALIFAIVTALVLLIFLSVITASILFILAGPRKELLDDIISFLFCLIITSIVVVLFTALLTLPATGRQSIQVDFFDTHFTLRSEGPFGKYVFETCYKDVEKVYISRLSKYRLWQKFVGVYGICYEIKKETRNGQFCKYARRVCRGIPSVYSLEEAEEIVGYIKNKTNNTGVG